MTTGYVPGTVTTGGGGGGGGDISTGHWTLTSPAGNYYKVLQGKGVSASDADTTVATIPIPSSPDAVYFIESSVSAKRDSGTGTPGDSAVYKIVSRFNMLSGVLTAMTEFTPITDESDLAWTVRHDISGNNVLIVVTGDAGETINWFSNNIIERAI